MQVVSSTQRVYSAREEFVWFKSTPHQLQQTSSTERKAQALVPVCCFVNKAIIRKAGNRYAIRK